MSSISSKINLSTFNMNTTATTTTNTTTNTVYQPKTTGVSIYDLKKERMIHFKNPYSTKAKKVYKQYLDSGIYEPWMILPPDLKHHPPSYTSSRHTFTRVKPKKPKAPTIEGRTSFKNFLASFTIHNHTNLKLLNGFKLLDQFGPTLTKYLQEHNGIKFYYNVRYHMRRMLNGEVLEEDKEWWRTSNIKSINDMSKIQDAVKASKNKLIQDIPEMEKKGSGWKFHKVLTAELHIGKYKAIKGGSYIDRDDNKSKARCYTKRKLKGLSPEIERKQTSYMCGPNVLPVPTCAD